MKNSFVTVTVDRAHEHSLMSSLVQGLAYVQARARQATNRASDLDLLPEYLQQPVWAQAWVPSQALAERPVLLLLDQAQGAWCKMLRTSSAWFEASAKKFTLKSLE